MVIQKAAKRLFDVVGASLALVALSPIIAVVAAIVRTRIGSPVFFRQIRPGRNGDPFRIIKFRTMTDERTPDGVSLSDEERLVEAGRRLRRWSLDELPELLNVVAGDMSLVGPRPLLMEYLPRYTAEQARRHEVRPGVTGLAQVSGRNDLPWEDRFDLDVWYVDNWSIWLDLKILVTTVGRVFTGRGVSEQGSATMTPFEGSSEERNGG
ncbi:MAG: sugar transferase [Acidobacteria bacterium]|nr:sugar transferase [Acidobacteriota bacterium]